MKTITNHIRAHLEKQIRPKIVPRASLDKLRESEWSPVFEQYMRNRLIMGSIRYEPFETKKISHNYDLMSYAIDKIRAYQETGNQENLVDCANVCMIEYECPTHPKPHFSAEDDGIHVPTV